MQQQWNEAPARSPSTSAPPDSPCEMVALSTTHCPLPHLPLLVVQLTSSPACQVAGSPLSSQDCRTPWQDCCRCSWSRANPTARGRGQRPSERQRGAEAKARQAVEGGEGWILWWASHGLLRRQQQQQQQAVWSWRRAVRQQWQGGEGRGGRRKSGRATQGS